MRGVWVSRVGVRGSFFFFSSRRRHTRLQGDWSSDVCSSDLDEATDYENRIEFGFLSQDGRALRALVKALDALAGEDASDARAHYLAAHANYRLGQVLNETRKSGADDAAKKCVEQLAALTRRESRDVEAFIQKAACHALIAATSVIKSV